jgi:hypothetical protein
MYNAGACGPNNILSMTLKLAKIVLVYNFRLT